MKTYGVYNHPTRGFEAIKIGFSWPAFFFGFIWAFVKSLWIYGIGIIVAAIILVITESLFREDGSMGGTFVLLLIQIGFIIFIGLKGNEWLANDFKKRGYEKVGEITANTKDSAIAQLAKQQVKGI